MLTVTAATEQSLSTGKSEEVRPNQAGRAATVSALR